MNSARLLTLAGPTLATALPLASGVAAARQLDPAKPEDALEISKRAQCGEADGKPAVYHWAGNVYSRVDGEPDRLLFKAEGMNIRQCAAITDPKRGQGWRLVSREILLYLDPKTGRVMSFFLYYNGITLGTENSKFKEVEGVLVPFSFSQKFEMSMGAFFAEFSVKEVKMNQQLGDDAFAIPR